MKSTLLTLGVLCALGRPGQADAAGGRKWDLRSGHVQVQMSGERLGAQISSMTEELRRYFGAPGDEGVLVGHVDPDSAAAKAGLAVGDVIVELDGQKVDQPMDLVGAVSARSAGTRVSLTVVRDKKRQTLTATLGDAPRVQAFGGDLDSDFDATFNWPSMPGTRALGRNFGGDELLKLQKQIETLEHRLEKLEKRDRAH